MNSPPFGQFRSISAQHAAPRHRDRLLREAFLIDDGGGADLLEREC
ncbi:MAG: hypothetical protein ABSG18_22810 [Steroidobacteraceae bacterium]|jgi:hypothetical protein